MRSKLEAICVLSHELATQ